MFVYSLGCAERKIRSIPDLLVVFYGWDLIVGLLLTPWLTASRASEPPP